LALIGPFPTVKMLATYFFVGAFLPQLDIFVGSPVHRITPEPLLITSSDDRNLAVNTQKNESLHHNPSSSSSIMSAVIVSLSSMSHSHAMPSQLNGKSKASSETLLCCSRLPHSSNFHPIFAVDPQTFERVASAVRTAQQNAFCIACCGEWGFCLCTGFFCIFFAHPCKSSLVCIDLCPSSRPDHQSICSDVHYGPTDPLHTPTQQASPTPWPTGRFASKRSHTTAYHRSTLTSPFL
jgi:hypothetical protein